MARPPTAGIVEQVAADALERIAPGAAADGDFDGADRLSVGGGHFAQECGQPVPVAFGAKLEQVAADQDIRMHREGALGGWRHEAQASLHVRDHDDVG